jgi:hypothetical protein
MFVWTAGSEYGSKNSCSVKVHSTKPLCWKTTEEVRGSRQIVHVMSFLATEEHWHLLRFGSRQRSRGIHAVSTTECMFHRCIMFSKTIEATAASFPCSPCPTANRSGNDPEPFNSVHIRVCVGACARRPLQAAPEKPIVLSARNARQRATIPRFKMREALPIAKGRIRYSFWSVLLRSSDLSVCV